MKKASFSPSRADVRPGGSAGWPQSRHAGWVRRVLLFAAGGLVALYVAGALGGYLWVRHVRKNESITFVDVALLRWKEVRRGMAVEQFAKAAAEVKAGNFQAAFLAYSFAVNNDPDNLAGRLAAAEFLKGAGSTPMALTMLEAGLARAPDEPRLIRPTFDLLTAAGRDHRVLELLRARSLSRVSGENGLLLRRYEIQATLNLGDSKAAKKLLEKYAELEKDPASLALVARVYWETQERLKAIQLLEGYVRGRADAYSDFALLAQWQLAAGMAADAVGTAERACAKFPADPAARLLLIEALDAQPMLRRDWVGAIDAYLKQYGDRPSALAQLAGLAGRKGWVELASAVYELGSVRQTDLGLLGLFYSDALLRRARLREAQQVLAQIETQVADSSLPFLVQLRQRQVIAEAALGDVANVREYTRRLASTLRNDAEGLERSRQLFKKAGILDAVAELSGPAARPLASVQKPVTAVK